MNLSNFNNREKKKRNTGVGWKVFERMSLWEANKSEPFLLLLLLLLVGLWTFSGGRRFGKRLVVEGKSTKVFNILSSLERISALKSGNTWKLISPQCSKNEWILLNNFQ